MRLQACIRLVHLSACVLPPPAMPRVQGAADCSTVNPYICSGPPPGVTAVSPSSARDVDIDAGLQLTLTGTGFGSNMTGRECTL